MLNYFCPFIRNFSPAYICGKIHAIIQSQTTPWLLTLPYKGINVYWIGESLGNCSGYEFNSYESLLIAVQTDHVQGISYWNGHYELAPGNENMQVK